MSGCNLVGRVGVRYLSWEDKEDIKTLLYVPARSKLDHHSLITLLSKRVDDRVQRQHDEGTWQLH